MSRTNTIKALVVTGAVAGAAFGLAPAQAANSTGMTITKVSPAKVALRVASPITIKGTGFDSTIDKVQFGSAANCASTKVAVASSTTMYVTGPTHADCLAGLVSAVTLFEGSETRNATFTGTDKTSVTFVAPVDVSGTLVSTPATGIPGTEITISVLAGVPTDKPVTATLGGKALQGVKAVSSTSIKGKVPAGLTPGTVADLVVTANGVSSASKASGFTPKSAIKVSPNIYLKSAAAAPEIKITGFGFKPSLSTGTNTTPVVLVCGQAATVNTTDAKKAYNNTTLYATVPAFAAIAANAGGVVDATDGGVCIVQVKVDKDGSGSGTATEDSVVTGGAGFVYAAY